MTPLHPSLDEIVKCIPDALSGQITDAQGTILYISERYARILGASPEELIGKPSVDIAPNSRMHIVGNTGIAEEGVLFRYKNGATTIINRLPLKIDGRVVGVLSFAALARRDNPKTAEIKGLVERLRQELQHYKNDLRRLRGAKYSIDQIKGVSPDVQQVKALIQKVARTRSTVLIGGETGVGKELVAHAIHQLSSRSHGPLVCVNCAAIPADLFESELFGYEDGAFTGAKKGGKIGKFELADEGTIILDEIQHIPMVLQPKLLRVIQEREVERVGGSQVTDIDVRLICITNKDLFSLVNRGEFREDLYYRINTVAIRIPPLRERIADLPLLVPAIIDKINHNLGLNISGVDDEVLRLFQAYDWPGNIRQLEHLLEGAANMAISGPLTTKYFEALAARIKSHGMVKGGCGALASAKNRAEKEMIEQALAETHGNVSKASRLLNIHRSVLYDKIKRYGIGMPKPIR